MLLVVLATVLAVTGAWYLTPEERWLDAVGGYETTLVANEPSAPDRVVGDHGLENGDGTERIGDEDVPMASGLQERRTTALMGRNMHFVIVGGIIVLIEVFVFLLYRVNRNIDTMRRRFR